MSKKNDQHGDVVLSQHEVIMEGNWEPIDMGKIRVFGKKYQSSFVDNKTVWVSDYGKENDMTSRSDESESTKIFQSFLTFKPYSTLSKKERKAYIQELIKEKKSLKPNKFYIFHGLFKEKEILYTEKKQFKKHLDELLLKYDPVYIKSSVINNLLVPTQNVLMFNKSCL
jgi:hypothetical protein